MSGLGVAFVSLAFDPGLCVKIQGQIIGYVVGIGARYITYLVILDEKGSIQCRTVNIPAGGAYIFSSENGLQVRQNRTQLFPKVQHISFNRSLRSDTLENN